MNAPSTSPRRRIQIMVEMPDDYQGTPEQALTAVNFLLNKHGLHGRVHRVGVFGPAMEPLAVVSTAHVTPETMQRLGDETGFEGLVHTPTPGEGAFLVVPRNAREFADDSRTWPHDLRLLMQTAHDEGLQWLKLDPAARVLPEVPVYEWPDNQVRREAARPAWRAKQRQQGG